MPNVCVTAFSDGQVGFVEVEKWPDVRVIQRAVGGMFVQVPVSFRLSFDEDWEEKHADQATVVYCNEAAGPRGLPINRSQIAGILNRRMGGGAPLLGDLFIVSGDAKFMASRNSRRNKVIGTRT